MSTPLNLAGWILRTIVPVDDVTALEASEPGYLTQRLASNWGWVKARLAKRYDVAKMELACPEICLSWLTALTTKDFYAKRGFNPSSASDESAILEAYNDAKAEVKEAADSKDGLFELPLAGTNDVTAITRGGPLGYSEVSPYVWQDVQFDTAFDDDKNRTGS